MITKITSANADKYRVLFAKATAALRKYDINGLVAGQNGFEGPIISAEPTYDLVEVDASTFVAGELFVLEDGVYRRTDLSEHYDASKEYYIEITNGEITSLEEYFEYIRDLNNISPIYTILPLDEDIFEIDANARTIAVPAVFKANGVSVQGDEISEVLYFKIDRFYDAEDFHNDDIYIEWRTPDGVEGVSKPWAVDLESHPGCIVFGWPLASEITKTPGQVTFSVRIYNYDEMSKRVLYSFSTLTNTVEIKAGINLEQALNQRIETPLGITDNEQLLKDRIINSERYDPNASGPQKPIFDDKEKNEAGSAGDVIIGLIDPADGAPVYQLYSHINKVDTDSKKFDRYNVYLTNPISGEEVNGFYRIRARVEDAGAISYAWIKLDEDGNILNDTEFTNGIVFLPTEDETFVDHRTYYEFDGENYNVYDGPKFLLNELGEETTESADPREVVKAIGDEPIALYERFSEVTLNAAFDDKGDAVAGNDNFVLGTYQPRITNRVGRKTDRVYGPVVSITGPTQPLMTDNGIVDNENYSWEAYGDHQVGGIIIEADGEELVANAALVVKAKVDTHGYTTFEWFKADYNAEGEPDFSDEAISVSEVADRVVIEADAIDEVTSEPLTITEPGFYKCVVHTLLNSVEKINPEAINATEAYIRATMPAGAVNLVYDETLIANGYSVNVGDEMKITVVDNEDEERTADDSYTYQWYRYVATSAAQTTIDKGLAADGVYMGKTADEKIEGLDYLINAEDVFAKVPNRAGLSDNGLYYCLITNHYNGSTFVQSTRFIENVDIADQN